MKRIMIRYNGEPIYPIVLTDSFDALGSELDSLGTKDSKVCIVTDSNVATHYLDTVKKICEQHSRWVTQFIFEAGEERKNLDTVQNLYEHLIVSKFERRDILIALGGGVVGDLTGYTAATYLRGIRFIQIPTSLLAQVDSSIGGKTGVDFKSYKNMVGAFYQPMLVYSNMATLQTLTDAQYISGMGEIIKHGLIMDCDYYNWLKINRSAILRRDMEVMLDMLAVSCSIKQGVVERDPKEAGERALLNFGHTLGHAVEKLMNFTMLHGECVAVGIHAAAWLSMTRGYLTQDEFDDILQTLRDFSLPTEVAGITPEDIVKISKSDKKMDMGHIKFVLLKGIGRAFIDREITDKQLLDAAHQTVLK